MITGSHKVPWKDEAVSPHFHEHSPRGLLPSSAPFTPQAQAPASNTRDGGSGWALCEESHVQRFGVGTMQEEPCDLLNQTE